MGQNQSKSSGRYNYETYKAKMKSLNDKYNREKSRNNLIEKKIKKLNNQLDVKNAEYTKLKNICMVKDRESIEETGRKIYNLLSKKYKENVKLMNTQQALIDKQNKLLGNKGEYKSKLEKQIESIDNNIIRNDRILELHGEENSEKDKTILVLKIVSIIIIILFLVNIYFIYR